MPLMKQYCVSASVKIKLVESSLTVVRHGSLLKKDIYQACDAEAVSIETINGWITSPNGNVIRRITEDLVGLWAVRSWSRLRPTSYMTP